MIQQLTLSGWRLPVGLTLKECYMPPRIMASRRPYKRIDSPFKLRHVLVIQQASRSCWRCCADDIDIITFVVLKVLAQLTRMCQFFAVSPGK